MRCAWLRGSSRKRRGRVREALAIVLWSLRYHHHLKLSVVGTPSALIYYLPPTHKHTEDHVEIIIMMMSTWWCGGEEGRWVGGNPHVEFCTSAYAVVTNTWTNKERPSRSPHTLIIMFFCKWERALNWSLGCVAPQQSIHYNTLWGP